MAKEHFDVGTPKTFVFLNPFYLFREYKWFKEIEAPNTG